MKIYDEMSPQQKGRLRAHLNKAAAVASEAMTMLRLGRVDQPMRNAFPPDSGGNVYEQAYLQCVKRDDWLMAHTIAEFAWSVLSLLRLDGDLTEVWRKRTNESGGKITARDKGSTGWWGYEVKVERRKP